MNFDIAVNTINTLLEKEKPEQFSSSWILSRTPAIYHFIRKNLRTENDDIDWDSFTIALNPHYLKRWMRYKRKPAKTSIRGRGNSHQIQRQALHIRRLH